MLVKLFAIKTPNQPTLTHKQLTTATLVAVVLAVAGCGSASRQLSRSELIAKADPICGRVVAKLAYYSSLKPSNTQDLVSLSAIVRAAPDISSVELSAQVELRKLNPPTALGADWKRLVTALGTLGKSTRRIGDVAGNHGGDLTTTVSAAEAGVRDIHTIAARDSFGECAKIGLTAQSRRPPRPRSATG